MDSASTEKETEPMLSVISNPIIQRMLLAAALSTVIGGSATTAIPGLSHWPESSVIAVVAGVALLAGLLRKLKVIAVVVVVALVTVALIAVDASTGGHIQSALNLSELVKGAVG